MADFPEIPSGYGIPLVDLSDGSLPAETETWLSGTIAGEIDAALADFTPPTEPYRVERIGFGGDSNTSYNNGDNWTLMLTNLSKGRAMRVGVWATGGIKIQGWRDSHLPTVLATTSFARPHAIVLMLGTNNVGESIPATIAAYRDEVLLPLRAAGIEPWVCSIPPREDTGKGWAQRFNNALKTMLSDIDAPMFDVYGALADPATGNFKSGFSAGGIDGSTGADPIHFFKQEPQAAVAKALRSSFLGLLNGPGAPFPATNVDAQNSAPNGRMLTGNGSWNGVNNTAGYAQQWQSSSGLTIASGAPSLLSDDYGSWQRLQNIDANNSILNTLARVQVIPGHKIVLCGKLRADGYGADAANYGASGTFYAAPTGGSSLGAVSLVSTLRVDLLDDPDGDFLSAWTWATVPAGAYFCRLGVTYNKGTGTLANKRLDYGMFNVIDLNRLAAEREVADASITSGQTTLTSATAAFTAGDVGKTINLYGAGSNQAPIVTTIAAYTNATTVTIGVAASTTLTGTGALVIAPPDTI